MPERIECRVNLLGLPMRYIKHLTPLDNFLRITWNYSLQAAGPMGEFSAWCLTGVAAIAALIIANIATVTASTSEGTVRNSLLSFTVSILAGALTKQLGIALTAGLRILDDFYAEAESEEFCQMIAAIQVNPKQVHSLLARPFWPVIRSYVRRCAEAGSKDWLRSEKRFVGLFCFQLTTAFIQLCGAAAGIGFLAFGVVK